MTPPLPSPPMSAFFCFIFSTTLISPTGEEKYSPSYSSVIFFKAKDDDILEQETGLFIFDIICSAAATSVYSSPKGSPFSSIKHNLSASGSTTIPRSKFPFLITLHISVRFSGKGSGLCAKAPSGIQLIFFIFLIPKVFKNSGIATPPTELIPSTATENDFEDIFSLETSLAFFIETSDISIPVIFLGENSTTFLSELPIPQP